MVDTSQLNAIEYTTIMDMEIQRNESEFTPYAKIINHTHNADRRQLVVRYGKVKMRDIVGVNDKVVHEDLSNVQRFYEGSSKSTSSIYNKFTQGPLTKQTITDAIAAAQMAAISREKDNYFLEALFKDTLTSATGSSTVSYDTNNTVPADTGSSVNTGLNIDKFEFVKEKMQKNGLTPKIIAQAGGVGMILCEEAHTDLRKMIQVNNQDYRNNYGVVTDSNGNITKFMGFDILHMSSQDLKNDYSQAAQLRNGVLRRIPVFLKGAIGLGIWASQLQKVERLPEIEGDASMYYTALQMGAARIDEKLVYDIQVTDSTLN